MRGVPGVRRSKVYAHKVFTLAGSNNNDKKKTKDLWTLTTVCCLLLLAIFHLLSFAYCYIFLVDIWMCVCV